MDANDVQQITEGIEFGTQMFVSGAKSAKNIKTGIDTLKSLFSRSREKSGDLESEFEKLAAKVDKLESKFGDQTPTESFPVVEPMSDDQPPTGSADTTTESEERMRSQLLGVLECVEHVLKASAQLNAIQQESIAGMEQIVDVAARLNEIVETQSKIIKSFGKALESHEESIALLTHQG
ncbi:hypothetical protein [Bifidobacterium scaligerum]|uniref:Uncharacterized protein n=1 Tax=Bifidobacterium scaligerum TaxID=2052656 RepID=A0A2M9HT27_9BIFI|nr:hypothetical protein [Bifidobacterium scaligerum]PJM79976.1 hypothetical protein CUU80_02245 [Bifidobacterium scaligerum]